MFTYYDYKQLSLFIDIMVTKVLHFICLMILIISNMPTAKKRINLTVSKDIDEALMLLAKKENTSLSAKAVDLIKTALELEEDINLDLIATKREESAEYINHNNAWS